MPRPLHLAAKAASPGAADAEPEGEAACLMEELIEEPIEPVVISSRVRDDVGRALRDLELHVAGELERCLALLEHRPTARTASEPSRRKPWKSEGDECGLGSEKMKAMYRCCTDSSSLQNVHLQAANIDSEASHWPGEDERLAKCPAAAGQAPHGAIRQRKSFGKSKWSISMSDSELQARSKDRNTKENRIFMARNMREQGGAVMAVGGTRLQRMVSSHTFELFWIACVVANTVVIGVQTQYAAKNPGKEEHPAFRYIQSCFTLLFIVELLLRIAGTGLRKLFCGLNKGWAWLDLVIVLASIFEFIIETIIPSLIAQEDGMNAGSIRTVRVIRLARLVRALRVQRLIRLVNSLRTLVYSIAVTLKSLVWALALLTIIMYMVGVALTQSVVDHISFGGPDAVLDASLYEFWRSLDVSMFTLFQSISGGLSWADAAKPLGRVSNTLVYLFAAYISFTYFAVLNVVTGVFCHSAIESAQRNPDVFAQALIANQKLYVKNIEKLFEQFDEDGSECITFGELEKVIADPDNRAFLAALEIEAMDAWTLFKLLDLDKDGVIEIDEFIAGCLQLKGVAKNVEIANLRYCLDRLDRKLGRFMATVEECRDVLRPVAPKHGKTRNLPCAVSVGKFSP